MKLNKNDLIFIYNIKYKIVCFKISKMKMDKEVQLVHLIQLKIL